MTKKEKRDRKVTVRFSQSEYAQILKNANREGLSVSDYIRLQATAGKKSIEELCGSYSELVYHVNKIGNNINQLARRANIQKVLDLEILEELKSIRNALISVLF